jgi:glyoxylase-like metal-dependent hydrolase (beta-lactamase superfamily II)
MSMSNALAVGTYRKDEAVPSRYEIQIGDVTVLVISDGVLPLSVDTMSTNADSASRAAWLKETFLERNFDWALNVVVIRSGDRTILVDSGLGDANPGFPRAGQLARRLEAAGIGLASITDIVLTHLHMDHCGGLLVDRVKKGLRPDVRIHVEASEIAFWASPDFSRTDMPAPVPDLLRAAATRFLSEYHNLLIPFEHEQEIAPGVTARRTGGHTPGHCVVQIASGGKKLMFAGDAVFPVSFDHPDWHNGFEHDPDEAVQVRKELFKELATTGGLMVAAHIPFPSIGHVAEDGKGFRWVPIFWDY